MRIAQTISIGLKSCYTKNRRTFLEKWQPKGRWNPRWWGSSHVEIFRWKTTFVLSEFRSQFSTTQNVYTVPNFFFVSMYFVCICLRSTSIVIRDSVTTVDGFFECMQIFDVHFVCNLNKLPEKDHLFCLLTARISFCHFARKRKTKQINVNMRKQVTNVRSRAFNQSHSISFSHVVVI